MTTTTPANHYDATGSGIALVVDTNGINGRPIVHLTVDGVKVRAELSKTPFGLEVTGTVSNVPDDSALYVRVTVPQVNIGEEPVSFAAVALLATARTGLAPQLVEGVIHTYQLRPLGGSASVVDSLVAVGSAGRTSTRNAG